MKILLFLILLFLTGIVIAFLYVWYRLHTQLNFHAEASEYTFPDGLTAETQFVTNANGQQIAYWSFPVKNPKAVVILVHGYSNPGGKTSMLGHVPYLRKAGYSTVLVDMRSFGESEGEKIYMGVKEWQDLEAVYDHLSSLSENKDKKIGYLGISMGATTSLVTVGKTQKGDFIIASVPYKNLQSLFAFRIDKEGFPASIFTPFMTTAGYLEFGRSYPGNTPMAVVGNIKVPVLLFSAEKDQTVDHEDASDIYRALETTKEYQEFPTGHDIFWHDPEGFQKAVLEFLAKQV
ncbi:MAG TPA: alpha/beta fold hydrolase [Vitreimonas sp.]|nr:alpha/beta fold hydrolase [Vitreimonas sp.]